MRVIEDQIKADEVSINSHSVSSLDTENSENETANVFSKTTQDLEENNISSEIESDTLLNENSIDETSEFLEEETEEEETAEEIISDKSDKNIVTDEKYEELANNTVETTVRRLSLFDTLPSENSETITNSDSSSDKSEPVLSSKEDADNSSKIVEDNNDNDNAIHQSEFDPEESNLS